MTTEKTLDRVSCAIAGIDVAASNERLAMIDREAGEFETAIEKANARQAEIATIIRDWDGPDAEAVGDALLSGDDALSAGPDITSLMAEKSALRAGVGDLRRRIDGGRREAEGIKETVRLQVAESLTPLIAHLNEQAIGSVEALTALYAAAAAIQDVCPFNDASNLAYALGRTLTPALGMDGVLENRDRFDVPPEFVRLLAELSQLGAAFPTKPRTSIARPWTH